MIIPIGSLLVTVILYWISKRVYRRLPSVWLTPLLVTPAAVILLLQRTHIPFDSYHAGAKWLSDLIGPATVAFAVPLYKNFGVLKKYAWEIIVSVLLGSFLAVASTIWLARLLHLNTQIVESLSSHSATTPIGVAVSQMIGGNPTITAVFVLVTGLIGMILGPVVVRFLHINNEIARGVLFGTSAHNAGTSKAFEFSSVSGTIASLSMILAAFFTMCMVPWLIK
jgi:predicted murein hydrolase (TIGR00659 family)